MSSEKEFLSGYNIKEYERPSLTADVAAFTVRKCGNGNYRKDTENRLCLLLIKRGNHPYKDHWALPGGFLQPDETVEDCALREITEETGVTPEAITPVGIYSRPGRDPRGWIISCAYVSVLSGDSVDPSGGDDAADACWFDVDYKTDENGDRHLYLEHDEIKLHAILSDKKERSGRQAFCIKEDGGLAFDHAEMIASALTVLKKCAGNFESIFDFLPEKFTLSALQKVQEAITGVPVTPANFRRKINGYVVETDEYTQGAGHRPAKLYGRR